MQKILLISGSATKTSSVGRAIETQLPYQVFSAFSPQNVQTLIKSRIFNLAVFDFDDITSETLQLVEWLREMDCNFPVLMVSKKITPEIAHQLNMMNDVYVLTEPAIDKSLIGLVKKLLVIKKVPRQNFKRYETNQIAHIEGIHSGDAMMTSMYNLSKGGAYCEFESPTVVSVGEHFRFKVYLNDTNSEYTFNARVVWTTPKGRFSGRFGCGLKFVSAQEVYRSQAKG